VEQLSLAEQVAKVENDLAYQLCYNGELVEEQADLRGQVSALVGSLTVTEQQLKRANAELSILQQDYTTVAAALKSANVVLEAKLAELRQLTAPGLSRRTWRILAILGWVAAATLGCFLF
jgi:chromosome segregation ATPase